MRVLILGETQFIGWHIAGHSVTLFHRGSTPLQGLFYVQEVLGEKAALPHFRDQFGQFRPDAVIDCIA